MGVVKAFAVAVLISIFFHQLVSMSCSQSWKKCGDNFCCCTDINATCDNKHLTYIPKLPSDIRQLIFTRNNIKTLSADTFFNISVSTITVLNLSSNGIEHIDQDTFVQFSQLAKLIAQCNSKISWSQLKLAFYNIPDTVTLLNLDSTGLTTLSDDIFDGLRRKGIERISLRHNNIEILNEESFYNLQNLSALDFRNNSIKGIFTNNGNRLGHRTIKNLELAYNKFVNQPPWFCKVNETHKALYPNLETLDLTGNSIMVLVRDSWKCLRKLKKLILAGNVVTTIEDDSFYDLVSLENLQVSYMAKPIQRIQPKAFHNQNLMELHFEHNNIVFKEDSDIPYDKLFTYCPNLSKLLMGYNDFRKIFYSKFERMFSPLTKLTELHLERAHLRNMPKRIFNKFTNLTKLYLARNKIKFMDPEAFVNVTRLEVFHINDNKIKVVGDTFPVTLRLSLKEVNMKGNPFSCSFCETANNTWFIHWIKDSKIDFKGWPSLYKCASPPSQQGTLLISHNPSAKACEINDRTIIAYATILVFVVVFAISSIAGYKGRWYIRYWTIKCRRKCVCGARGDPEKQRLLGDDLLYDAFVIYHDNDRGFVRNEILKFMEKEHNYKLFIWDRDFTAGDQTVGIVVDNIYKSNHVIAVISKSFLKDQWCEFQLAVSLDRQIELKTNFLTLITLENIDKKLLSKSWCVLLTKTTTAEWYERKNDIGRKLFEKQILTNVPCKLRLPKDGSFQR